jgi:hypothetical protein
MQGMTLVFDTKNQLPGKIYLGACDNLLDIEAGLDYKKNVQVRVQYSLLKKRIAH